MSKAKILVVEDEEEILELITYNLSREGYDVHAVRSGEEALKLIQSKTPDLMLLDLMLPGVDGLEVCKTVKGNPAYKAIFPSSCSRRAAKRRTLSPDWSSGADDYITKPFSRQGAACASESGAEPPIRRGPISRTSQEAYCSIHNIHHQSRASRGADRRA
jgi:CheY-like chemotaxis protein